MIFKLFLYVYFYGLAIVQTHCPFNGGEHLCCSAQCEYIVPYVHRMAYTPIKDCPTCMGQPSVPY